jgi:hypothetical protein
VTTPRRQLIRTPEPAIELFFDLKAALRYLGEDYDTWSDIRGAVLSSMDELAELAEAHGWMLAEEIHRFMEKEE